MKRELTVYYISRALLSALVAFLMVWWGGSVWWMGVLLGVVLFGGFLYYAHNGHYRIDLGTPLAPLRRDDRAQAVRDRAVVIAAATGGVSFALLSQVGASLAASVNWAGIALGLAILTYFGVSEWLFARH